MNMKTYGFQTNIERLKMCSSKTYEPVHEISNYVVCATISSGSGLFAKISTITGDKNI